MSAWKRARISYANVTATLALVLAAGGAAWAVGSTTPATIHACASKRTGALRLLRRGRCKRTETALTWNAAGRPGATGTPGRAGAIGLAGASGLAGGIGSDAATLAGHPPGDFQGSYKSTIVVSPVGSQQQNGQALRNGLAAAAAANAPRLVVVEPGTYDIGAASAPLSLPANTNMVGAGRALTVITASGSPSPSGATVRADSGGTISDLAILNTGGGAHAVALGTSGGALTLRWVRVRATGGTTDDTAIAAGGGSLSLIDSTADALVGGAPNVNGTGIGNTGAAELVIVDQASSVSGQTGTNDVGITANGELLVTGGSSVFASGQTDAAIITQASDTLPVDISDASVGVGDTHGFSLDLVAPSAGSNVAQIRNSKVGPNVGGGEAIDAGTSWTVDAGASQLQGLLAGPGNYMCAGDFDASFNAIPNGSGC